MPHELAQVLVPRESTPEGGTSLNEVSGHFKLSGRVLGERIDMEGPGVFEFVRDG